MSLVLMCPCNKTATEIKFKMYEVIQNNPRAKTVSLFKKSVVTSICSADVTKTLKACSLDLK